MEPLIILGLSVFIVFNIIVIIALLSLIKLMKNGSVLLVKTADQAKGTLKQIDDEIDHIRTRMDESFDSIDKTLGTSNNYLAELRGMTTNVNQFLEYSNATLINLNEESKKINEFKPALNHTADIINLSCLEFIGTLRKIDYSIESFTANYSPTVKFINNAYTNYYKPARKVLSMVQLVKKGVFGLFKKN